MRTTTSLPRWRLVVAATAASGALLLGIAVAQVVYRGMVRLPFFLVGTIATVGVNYIYVFVVRKGVVREAIDISEAAIVALALVLPPGEALLAFVLASAVGDLRRDSALVKKVFNIAVRAVAAALLLGIVSLAGSPPDLTPTAIGAVVLGALVFTATSALIVAVLIASIGGASVGESLRSDLGLRGAVWASAVAVGITSARLALHAPIALTGVLGALVIVAMTAKACSEAQLDRVRLQRLLTASAEIQSAVDEQEQQSALLAAANELLPWRQVTLQEVPPQSGEGGERLELGATGERWLVARPQPGSDPWTDDDDLVLRELASAAGAALERVRLRDELVRQSRLDPLTGLANRRRFDEELGRMLADSGGEGIAVLLIDLDLFKAVNDTLGHDVGDAVLKTVASRLMAAVRTTDLVARVGGDEFVVVLQGVTNPEVASRVASYIQSSLDEPADLDGCRLPTSASIGVAIGGLDGRTMGDLLRRADDLMYQAKQRRAETRDLVTVATASGQGGLAQADFVQVTRIDEPVSGRNRP